jgi:hypothetical protein
VTGGALVAWVRTTPRPVQLSEILTMWQLGLGLVPEERLVLVYVHDSTLRVD